MRYPGIAAIAFGMLIATGANAQRGDPGVAAPIQPVLPPLDAPTIARIDAFVAGEVTDSRIPGLAIAVLQHGRAPHVRGFGHDGRGKAISGDTPLPIGSLTKSFTALLVRQAIEAGYLEADAPVQRYLPMSATLVAAFAPDLALVLAAVVVLLCLPIVGRAGRWAGRILRRASAA